MHILNQGRMWTDRSSHHSFSHSWLPVLYDACPRTYWNEKARRSKFWSPWSRKPNFSLTPIWMQKNMVFQLKDIYCMGYRNDHYLLVVKLFLLREQVHVGLAYLHWKRNIYIYVYYVFISLFTYTEVFFWW